MKVIKSIPEVREAVKCAKKEGKTIALVPTMGYLHEGHISLVRIAGERGNFVVVSIFVNPLQFGPSEDLKEYPRDLNRDIMLLEREGVDLVFAPDVEEMYPEEQLATVEVKGLTEVMCGAYRPGHFTGVATVVMKLFNIVQPDIAVFGQKDAQQAAVIKKMVKDLNLPVEIIVGPVVREEDGLAMSSRNVYLNSEEREAALVLYRALKKGENLLDGGVRSAKTVIESIEKEFEKEPLARLQYVYICHPETLKEIINIEKGAMIAVAAFIGKTRLIDNILWEG
ncbi:Pantothenate synthetase [Koleobacter methoxysyntrophicus]|uniref:Pantothenate synthetase n=1 Tax=Koleobacter methoxysyntrophicus TaxID=2751313 RepID=A0A8A0RJH5_9FIRM|nr:pantoate--beta-alanine ligase [Koleobacter methoxysyntrophicus]QSQ08042.1 Pantothenate synthetase [Koleobacter methoxysyntrophicus]